MSGTIPLTHIPPEVVEVIDGYAVVKEVPIQLRPEQIAKVEAVKSLCSLLTGKNACVWLHPETPGAVPKTYYVRETVGDIEILRARALQVLNFPAQDAAA